MALHSEARTVANSKEDENLTLAELLQITESGSGCDGSAQVLLSMEKVRSLTISYVNDGANGRADAGFPSTSFALDPRSFGSYPQPLQPQWMNNGPGFPNFPQPGQQGVQQPMPPMPTGDQGNWQGAGAAWNPGRVVQAASNLQPRNPATNNAASNAPVNLQQPAGGQASQKRPANGAPGGNQPAAKRRAGEEPSDQQPAPQKYAGGRPAVRTPAVEGLEGGASGEGSASEGSPGCQPGNNNTTRTALPTNDAATMSIAERLDRGLITDVAGLTRQEQDELLVWARDKGIKWKDILVKFKFKVKESTLRGRYRKMKKGPLPRKPEFTERDNELLLEAIEHIAGGHPDDIENTNIRRLWTRAQEYIKKHGGKTEAGPGTLKKKYKEFTKNMPDIREDLKPSKAKWDHKAYKNYSVQGQEEATFDDDDEEEPAGKRGTPNGDAGGKALNKFEWNHSEYEKYEVEYEEGANFGETEEDEQEPDDEHEEPDDEEYEEDEEGEDTDA
ncbi:hypothetical protein FJTKL_09004 [Diaporthe vaccinii]|uniref:Myb-like domain-containing protein n=1 Tax=Diaporthe vaccinii TaxID=105482 RepID=A0ABR4EPB3_9PEZI